MSLAACDVSPSGLCQEWRKSRAGGVGLPGTAPATESLLPITPIKLCHCLPKHRRMEPVIPPPHTRPRPVSRSCSWGASGGRSTLQSHPARCVALSRLLAPLSRCFFSLPDWLSTASCSTCGLPAGSFSPISAGSLIPPGVYIQTVGTVTSGHPAPQHPGRPRCYFYLRLVNLPRRSGAAPASRCS